MLEPTVHTGFMANPPVPNFTCRELGAALKEARKRAGPDASGLTLEAAGELTHLSASALSRQEAGTRIPHLNTLNVLIKVYAPSPAAERHIRDLYAAATGSPWWQPFDVDEPLDALLRLEETARCIRTYHPNAFPGLVQTEEYARHFLADGVLPGGEGELERRLELRMRRQHILDGDHPPTVHIILDEAAFHTGIGGPEVIARQCAHLLELTSRPTVQCQILPMDSGAHAGRDGAFVIFDRPPPPGYPHEAPEKSVYIQGLHGALIPESPAVIARYTDGFEQLAGRALSPAASRKRLSTMATVS